MGETYIQIAQAFLEHLQELNVALRQQLEGLAPSERG
jgi:hypothetical protein